MYISSSTQTSCHSNACRDHPSWEAGMKGRTDRTSCLHKDYRGMSSTVHPRRGSGVTSGEGQFERGMTRAIREDKTTAKITIGPVTLAKTKIQNTWVFCCTVYTARKPHNIQGFWHEKRMREKPRISYLCFGKWCACATSLYLWPYTCSAHYVAGRGRVIPLKVTYHVTKNPNNTGEIGASVYIGKKPVKFWRSFKKSRCGGGFFDSFFLECLGEVA